MNGALHIKGEPRVGGRTLILKGRRDVLDHNHRAATERTSPERNGRVGVSASWRRSGRSNREQALTQWEPPCRVGG